MNALAPNPRPPHPPPRPLQGHIGAISSVAYSPTGHTVGSGAADATIRLWDATRGQQTSGVQVRRRRGAGWLGERVGGRVGR